VEDVVATLTGIRLEDHAIHIHHLGPRINLGAQLGDHVSVHEHLAPQDQLVAATTGGDPVVREELVQAHHLGVALGVAGR